MQSLLINKLLFVVLLITGIGFFTSAGQVHAGVVPDLNGRVINAITNAPIAGVWVAMRTYNDITPCGVAASYPKIRYERTNSNGEYNFDGIMPIEGVAQHACYDARLGRQIDTNLDGVNDAQQIPRMPVSCYTTKANDFYAPRRYCTFDFGCLAAPYEIYVVKPVGYAGYFVPMEEVHYNNAETTYSLALSTVLYYPIISTISGKVFVDENASGLQDAGESGYKSLQIKLSGATTANTTSDANGNYSFPNLPNGTYTVAITAPKGSSTTTATSQTTTVTPSRTINFGISPLYSVAGNIYKDANNNGVKDAGEANYSGTPAVSANRGKVTANADGSYVISELVAGTVTISLTNLPSGYKISSPLNGPPPSYQVTVGPGCSVNGTLGASCQ